MLGWHITVRWTSPAGMSVELGRWQSGASGVRWLDDLVAKGRASRGDNGYPLGYTVRVEDATPVLRDGPPSVRKVWMKDPGDVVTKDWGKSRIDLQALDAVPPGEMLYVEAWDES